MAKFLLSAFADEGGKGIANQIAALKDNHMGYIEPRGLDYGNISEYTAEQCRELRKVLDEGGIGVSAMGSPFGKMKITDDFTEHFESFKRCVENACILGTERIRMFSFYKPEGETWTAYRDTVFERLEQFADYSLKSGVYCCHENEKEIYGEKAEECYEILSTFEGKIKGVFDPANFVQAGVDILPAYEKLEKYIDYMHIKDGMYADGSIVPAGKGEGKLPELLALFAKKPGEHFLTLEPHLKVFDGLAALENAGGTADKLKNSYAYPTNRDAFNAAAEALHGILKSIGEE